MCGKRGRVVRWEWEGCVVRGEGGVVGVGGMCGKGGGRCGGRGKEVWLEG